MNKNRGKSFNKSYGNINLKKENGGISSIKASVNIKITGTVSKE
jgi:hypothetical protein